MCFHMHLYVPIHLYEKMLIISNDFSFEASGPMLLKFLVESPWAREQKIAKMVIVL